MISMNAAAIRQPPWTDQTLMGQMSVINTILQSSHVDWKYMSNQCLLFSRILDSLVAYNWKPIWRNEMLPLMRKICKHKDNPDARPAMLILLLSIKDAFRTEWLSSAQVTENDEIFTTLKLVNFRQPLVTWFLARTWLKKEATLFDTFTTGHDVPGAALMQPLQCGGSAARDFQEARIYLDCVSSRFYPRLHVNSIFVAVDAKVGYEVLCCDFNVPRMHVQDRVRLYVLQKENTETSTCIVTPLQVNILVNGHQVENRVTSGYMDAGPQMPSDVTNLVKVGPNVLQAIGEFSVPYMIAVASSRAIERSSTNAELQDYVAPAKAASDGDITEVDDEVVEGASRVSLRCPISHQRLVMPVKAATCRHLQCFDFDSFLEINGNRPAWRCPCCNSFISCPDLRIDRQMEKVLKDTDVKVHEVIFNQDGTWVPVPGDDVEMIRGSDVVTIEGGEGGSRFIDLSDVDDTNVNGTSDVFHQRERKPDAQTLQATLNNRGIATNPVIQQPNIAGHPTINVPQYATVASQSSPTFAGPMWVGAGGSEGNFVNLGGGVIYTPPAGTVDNQSAPSIQSMSAVNHNFQIRFPRSSTATQVSSPAGPVNRLVPNGGHATFTPLQPPQNGAAPTAGFTVENGRLRQRQAGQQLPGASQTVQERRSQWRSTEVPSTPQFGTNTTQSQNLHTTQHLNFSQSQVSQLQRQHASSGAVFRHQHASPGNHNAQPLQRLNPGTHTLHQHAATSTGASHQQHSSPGALQQQQQQQQQQHHPSGRLSPVMNNAQQSPGQVWGGAAAANVGQWRSTTTQAQVLGVTGALEQTWRPATQRMRTSIPAPVMGSSPSVAQQQQQRASPSFPSSHAFTTSNSIPAPRFQTYPPVSNIPAANNVALYNGTTWVNAPDFSVPPVAPSREPSDAWIDFDLPDLTH